MVSVLDFWNLSNRLSVSACRVLLFFVSLSLLPIIVYSLFASYKLSDTIQKDNEKYENLDLTDLFDLTPEEKTGE